MLINSTDFFQALLGMHDCAITGRKGSGKTLLSVVIADYLLRQNYITGVWANFAHSLPLADSLVNALIIVDEAAQWADSRFSSMSYDLYSMWARKSNSIYLYPSVNAVDKRVRNLEVMRIYAIDLLPVQIWIYYWQSTYKQKGYFLLVNPEKYFGLYDTYGVPVDDGGTLEAIIAMYPDAVREMLEARSGNRIQKLFDRYMAKHDPGNEKWQPRGGGMVGRGEFEALRREVAQLRGMVMNGSNQSSGSLGGFRN